MKAFLVATAAMCLAVRAWANGVDMPTDESTSDPRGKTYTGSVRFNMMNEEYALKYTVLVGDKKSDKALEDTCAATLKKICIRKSR
ncbi:hypothetical protein HJC22_00480 [Corallococcus exiguus]|uniref:hypothetical protein n=1 Tax=Corallococcus exiguus TaxID=83462 RepID=UPI0014719F31|nr:hypothetical protein [Corallococcus exiguus]NNC14205.1 hypothetical protein [Corallococcus exiguus]